MEEKWSEVVGFGDLGDGYWISSYGRVFSTKLGEPKRKKTFITTCGYEYISLCNKERSKSVGVHVLVALAFIDKEGRDKGLEVNHKDLNKENNRVENLEWVTHQENMQHQTNYYRPKRINKCPLCGKEIGLNAKYCVECSARTHRKFEVTREELKKDLLLRSYAKIGEKYNIKENSVRKRCKSFGLPSDVPTLKNTSDKGILNENWNDMLEYNLKQRELREVQRHQNRVEPKRVAMVDPSSGETVKEFNSIADAGRFLQKKPVHIPDVCRGKRKIAYGYFWKYL